MMLKRIMTVICIAAVIIPCPGTAGTPGVRGQIILVQAPGSDFSEFNAFLKTNPNFKALSDFESADDPSPTQRTSLISNFESATREFLNGSNESAIREFENVTMLSRVADWTSKERSAIHFSYIRLAQLTSGETQKKWLKEAVVFDPDLFPDREMVPPPLVEEFNQVRKSVLETGKIWDISGFRETYTEIRVNGRRFRPQQGGLIRIPEGSSRITLLSNLFPRVVRVLNAQQVTNLSPAKVSSAIGSCDQPELSTTFDLEIENIAIFYSAECVVVSENEGWKRVSSISPALANVKRNPAPSIDYPQIPVTESKSILKNTSWVWIGATVVVGAIGLALVQNAKRDPTRVPTHD